MDRCYSNGLPDGEEVPKALLENLKVPSYKAIALCILNNDLRLRKLGFPNDDSEIIEALEKMKKQEEIDRESGNLSLF